MEDLFENYHIICSFKEECSHTNNESRALFLFFQTCENLAKGLFAEHKKTRVPGEPRDFVDCYLDKLDKVRVENIVLSVSLCGANNS